jgi:hypothetical protein
MNELPRLITQNYEKNEGGSLLSKVTKILSGQRAAILEYLGEGARDPNLDNENGTTRGPFLNQSLWARQSPMMFPAI